jgi:hypothetical protein
VVQVPISSSASPVFAVARPHTGRQGRSRFRSRFRRIELIENGPQRREPRGKRILIGVDGMPQMRREHLRLDIGKIEKHDPADMG